jgi:hypothetical protein
MKINKLLIVLGLLVVGASACQEEYEVPMIMGNELAGEWYVTYKVGGVDIYGVGYSTMLTTTTADASTENDAGEILVTDLGHFWDYKAKTPSNTAGLSFGSPDSTMNLVDGYPIMMVVRSGKIFTDGGRSKTGVVADSIWMEMGFEDDSATVFEVSGHRRTGFLEDDY